jgi:hypothetical protein
MLALASGAYIFLAFVVVMFFVVAFSYYTRRGSGIDQRPSDGRGGSPGAAGESHISTADDEVERTVGTRGTR